ncbi:MAG: aldo/keto reductase [Planctomycetota bacterium]
MRKVTLGRSGLEVSAVGFGGIPIQRISESEAERVIDQALDLGVTLIDTAAGYGDSETKIGRAIRGRRDGLVLASKSGRKDREGILGEIDRSRRSLGVEVVDLYQLHNCATREAWEQVSGAGGAMEGLLEARDRGWIGHIGFTSHSLDMALELIEQDVFETVQFPFNLVTREPAEGLIPRCRELGLGFVVMKPLCGGQYDDATLAFKFLNAYPDLVAIPGIERVEEIEQIAALVTSGETLGGEELRRAEQTAERLGKLFCRRCGYCMPCPSGVPIQLAMIFDSFIARMPADRLVEPARRVAEGVARCTDCGMCEDKCPYDLPIRVQIRAAAEKAETILVRSD